MNRAVDILILGGTKFVGRHITQTALDRGHTVTLFNRGKTNGDLFPDVEKLYGNRDGGLDVLRGRSWDAAIDVNGYFPRLVTASAQLLANQVARYVFISTLSVLSDPTLYHQNEDAPLASVQDPTTETITGESYGGLKVLCEQAVERELPGRALIARPGYVVGPYDHTDRWTSWLRRVARGGEMLVPGAPDAPIQFIDGRDLAAFVLNQVEQQATGVFNVTGPAQPLTWGEMLDAAKHVTSAKGTFTWVSEEFIKEQGIDFEELPMYGGREDIAFMTVDCSKAIGAGLRFRPLAETIQDTLNWDKAQGKAHHGLTPERESELLRAWHLQHSH